MERWLCWDSTIDEWVIEPTPTEEAEWIIAGVNREPDPPYLLADPAVTLADLEHADEAEVWSSMSVEFPELARAWSTYSGALRGLADRVAAGDLEAQKGRGLFALALWLAQQAEQDACTTAVRVHVPIGGYPALGAVAGITKQAAHQRYMRHHAPPAS
jgi:hypothetical protein